MRSLICTLALVLSCGFAVPVSAEQMWSREFGDTVGMGTDEFGTGSYLGVGIENVTAERLAALKLKDEHGVEVITVDQDSPAGKAGLKEHDVILSLNGTAVESGAQLKRMILETPAGRQVTLAISRDGQPMALKIQLADRRKALAWKEAGRSPNAELMALPNLPAMPDFDIPNVVVVHSSARSGLMVENITPQLGEFFGVKSGQGVLVRSVEKGSQADKSGLKAGDVIVRINDQKISDVGDFTHALRARKTNNVTIGIIRDRREQNLSVTLPDRKQSMLIDESWEMPVVTAQMQNAFSQMRSELEKAKPQIEKAMQQARQLQKEQLGKQFCKMRKDLEKFSQDGLRQFQDKLQLEFDDDGLI